MTEPPLALPNDREPSGRDLGDAEIENLVAAIRSARLNATGGTWVARLEREFAARMGARFSIACASGTAAVHAALATLDLQPGDEVLTTPVTDMGAILPILYEGAVPRFVDVDPATLNVTAATIERELSPRARAVIVTHLFGAPCAMTAIRALAEARNLVLIEDCAQAYLAECDGTRVGRFGALATYSLQQGKHMTTGEGGLVTTDDPALARRVTLFVNKGWAYGEAEPDHVVPVLNYRMTELAGAVGTAQLAKLEGCVARRRARARRLDRALRGLAGVRIPEVPQGSAHSYWRYCVQVDPELWDGGAARLAAFLQRRGIGANPHYVKKPAFACEVFARWRQWSVLRVPYEGAGTTPPPADARARYPGVYDGLARVLVLPWNEQLTDAHVDGIARAFHDAAKELQR